MSEEILQRGLDKNPEKIGKWDFYNIGSTSIKTLKEWGIIHNFDYGKRVERKKVDGIIVYQKNVIAIIENKSPKEFNTEKKQDKAIKQEIEVAKKLDCPIIIATDTQETIWVNSLTGKKILNEDKTPVSTNWDPVKVTNDNNLIKLMEKIVTSIDGQNNQIIPKKFVNPTDLAKQIWQDIWSVSGATPENCLYTFVELFIFKYLSDLGVLHKRYNFDSLMKMYDEDFSENEVLEHYADHIRKNIKKQFPHNQDDGTTIINGTIFVSKDQKSVDGYSSVFRKVLTKFQNYGKLENINHDFKSQLFESFLKESISKKNWGQFFTPLKVIRSIEKMASSEIKEGAVICDPACGVGKFLLEPIKNKLTSFFEITDTAVVPKITIIGFDKGFDKDEQKTIILAKANMLIYFSDLIKENPNLTKAFSKLFNETFNLKTNSILGTLSEPVQNKYDLILTNPPYVTSGSSNLKEEISKNKELEKHYKINGMGVEGLFMEWIIQALKPNGKAMIVVPDGLFNRKNDTRLRKFIKNECFLDAIISLPLNTFFSTSKKTYILAITKKGETTQIQKNPVFAYLVSEIGESRDNYRFDIDQDDLSDAVNQFNLFKGAKAHYKTDNKRCRVLDINWFDDFDSWIIDNCWTDEEKIELGVLKENEAISVDEFTSLMDEMSNTILSLKEEIQYKDEKRIDINDDYKAISILEIFGKDGIKKGLEKYTNAYVQKHKGDYPLYSSKTVNNGIIGYIDSYDYNLQCITWTTDGLHAGTVFLRDRRFSMTTHCGALIPNNKFTNISLNYIFYYLKNNLKDYTIGEQNKRVTVGIIKKVMIQIPTKADGSFDIEKQEEIAEKYQKIERIKTAVSDELLKIKNTTIEL